MDEQTHSEYWAGKFESYRNSVETRLTEIETDIAGLEAENNRLRAVKEGAISERNACVALVLAMARKLGWPAGITPVMSESASASSSPRHLVCDLPEVGQVCWELSPEEAESYASLPSYAGAVESLSVEQSYARVFGFINR